MSPAHPARAVRVSAPSTVRTDVDLPGASYRTTYQVPVPPGLTAERWARHTFERAPWAMRTFVRFGWRFVLGLRLASDGSTQQVAGWALGSRTDDAITMTTTSRWLTAEKITRIEGDLLVVSTSVRFERAFGRLLWAVVVPVHHLTEPLLLTSAVRRPVG
jgi:Protein of unknown function (DUF2867)